MGWTGRGKAGEYHAGKRTMVSACNSQNASILLPGMFYQRAKVWEMPKCRNALASRCKPKGFAGLGRGRILPAVPQIWRLGAGDVGRGSVGLFGVLKGT